MRRILIAFALACLPGLASAGGLALSLDQSVRMTLGSPAQDVIVGNPEIADVTVADPRHLIITGKKFGVTNLIVVNTAGRTIYNSQLVVSTTDRGKVSVYQGPMVQSFACSPRCVADANGGGAAAGGAGYYGASAPRGNLGGIQASPQLP